MKEGMFYKRLENKKVQCNLCYQNCTIPNNEYGFCLARKNEEGALYSEVYGKLSAVNIDPIEKKPLYHFLPGSKAFSIGTCGCNFKCEFCQNYQISQVKTKDYNQIITMTPNQVVNQALVNDCKSIAYTYNEPTINYEFALETAKKAVKKGLKNVFITNGYIQEEPLNRIKPYLHAVNIDIKSLNPEFYKKFCKANLKKVLKSIKKYYDLGIHIELTNLIIPGENDSKKEVNRISSWIINNLSKNTPVHFSRFHPCYKLSDREATPQNNIISAVKTAKEQGLRFVYPGNIRDTDLNNTYCPNCGTLLINRKGYTINTQSLNKGVCEECGEELIGYY